MLALFLQIFLIPGGLLIFGILGCGSKKKPPNENSTVSEDETRLLNEEIEAIKVSLDKEMPNESEHTPGCRFEFGNENGQEELPCDSCFKYMKFFITQWNKSLHDPEILDFLAQYLAEDRTYKSHFKIDDVTRKIQLKDEIAKVTIMNTVE